MKEFTKADMSASMAEYEKKWAIRMLDLATHVAQWSKDPSTKVGAVIADNEMRVVSLGYNGFPRSVTDSVARYQDRALKHKMVVHAEANAILNARIDVTTCMMYTTMFPCSDCAKLIIQAGILQIYYLKILDHDPWKEDVNIAQSMFSESFVQTIQVTKNE